MFHFHFLDEVRGRSPHQAGIVEMFKAEAPHLSRDALGQEAVDVEPLVGRECKGHCVERVVLIFSVVDVVQIAVFIEERGRRRVLRDGSKAVVNGDFTPVRERPVPIVELVDAVVHRDAADEFVPIEVNGVARLSAAAHRHALCAIT